MMQGSSLKDDRLEDFRLLSELKGMDILLESQHTKQVDSKDADILGNSSAQSSAGCQPRLRPHASGKRENFDAGSVSTPSSKRVDQGVGQREQAAENIMGGEITGCWTSATGHPVRYLSALMKNISSSFFRIVMSTHSFVSEWGGVRTMNSLVKRNN